jgi:FkbM family methyltransferase
MLLDFDNLYKKYNFDIKGIIHIGAHYGTEYTYYEKHNIKKILFFEPQSHVFRILQENLKGKNVKLVNKALGNDNKQVSMYVESANNSQSSSILRPQKHLQQYPWIQFNRMIVVDMIKLDDYLGDSKTYNFINIDVQGYELEVFKGASKILNNIDYIISEVNFDEVYKGCARVEQLDEFLGTYGFERVETNPAGISWGDSLYIKYKN